jgi:hypothetical protein
MPRSGGGLYSLPAGSLVADGVDDILGSQHNGPLNDIALDMNTPRPIVAGGTGASTAGVGRANLGIPFDLISQGNLSGVGISALVPSEYDAIELTYWDYVPSTSGTVLNFGVGSGTLASPVFGVNHFEQIQALVGSTYTPGNNSGLGAVSVSFNQINSELGSARIFAVGFNSVGRIQGEIVRRGVIAGPVRASSTGTFGEATDVNHTLFSLYVSVGSLAGKYRLMGYRK